MEQYHSGTYGKSFADVYDEWYGDLDNLDQLIDLLVELAGDGPVCELGVGTGRIAMPLANAGLTVIGVDSSPEMLDQLANRDTKHLIEAVHGDMVDDIPPGPFTLVVIAFNTLFNLLDHDRQAACLQQVASRLGPTGRLVIDAIVPDLPEEQHPEVVDDISVRELGIDRVVLSISRHHPNEQSAEGQFVEITESGGVRLRPWSVRYATPQQIDAMATHAGIILEHRWESPDRAAFTPTSGRHVSVYRRAGHYTSE